MKKRIADHLRALAVKLDPPPPMTSVYVDHNTYNTYDTGSVTSGIRIITNR
jgi:hypothetical protein